jgi:DNA segregation ATPase FtsK/SpoIIIE, S-DNA-T family
MATRKKKNTPDPNKLTPEKEADINVTEVVKDERTQKILGTVFLLLAVFLFIAFTSYCFTWKEDQDKVQQHGGKFLFAENIPVSNLLGRLGAWVGHLFMYQGFGLAAFLLCTTFFVLGINSLAGKKLLSPRRNLRYVLPGLLIFSVALAFILPKTEFAYGGGVGNMISAWLNNFIGPAGTLALLACAGLAYVIWQFNPAIKVPQRAISVFQREEREEVEKQQEVTLSEVTPPVTAPTINEQFTQAVPTVVAPVSEAPKGNILKGDGHKLIIVPAKEEVVNPVNRFGLQEREVAKEPAAPVIIEEEPEGLPVPPPRPPITTQRPATSATTMITVEPPVVILPKKPVAMPALELEIKPPAEDIAPQFPEIERQPETAAEKVKALPPYDPVLDLQSYKYPSLELLEAHGGDKIITDPAELETNKNQIITTLKNYDIDIQRISATVGPTVTLYEIVPAAGVRISRIKNLEDDIALSLSALGIRIIAPIPGKGTIGIEVPNHKKTIVSMRTMLASDKFQKNHFALPIAIGKKIDNENFIVDLTTMPHLLMAGATGQGKSVGLNAILVSLLYKKHPSQLKFVLIDPKKVELSIYRVIEKHFLAKLPGEDEPIITDTKKVVYTLNALCIEMDNRYDLLKEAGTRNIKEYNEKFAQRRLNPAKGHQYLPFIVLVIDEFADLIMTAGKEVEMPIARLAQLARAVGIHLIIATQRPSVNIITGTIKANFPARIAFKVSSKIDSRTILDAGGAEQLIGKGDMLISYNGEITRLQCAFVDTPEVESVVDFIGEQQGYPQPFHLPEYVDEKEMAGKEFDLEDKDPLFEEAARLIVQNQVGSTSLIQRRMKLGYNRAGRLMDQLEAAGIVGPNMGSKAREVLCRTEAELEELL